MPFAGYSTFQACVSANKDKKDPKAYCGSIMHEVEGARIPVSLDPKLKMDGQKIYGVTEVYSLEDASKNPITINPAKGDVVETILHEQLHAVDPMMDHEKVYKMAAHIEESMTLPQMAKVLLDTHDRAMNPVHRREMTHTRAGNVISSHIK